MWLSQQFSRPAPQRGAVSTGRVTIAGEKAAVMLSGERRELSVALPAGLHWTPALGDEVLVLETGEGESYIIGLAAESSAGGSIEFGGDMSIGGRLILNGVDVGAALAALGG